MTDVTKTRKTVFQGFVLMLALLFATGCGKAAPQETTGESRAQSTTLTVSTTTASTTRQPTATPMPTRVPVNMNPLTGQYSMDPENAGKRPVAIMFSNIQVALPQLGIGSADLYYEMVVESGYTRLMALFADANTIPEVLSIRSTRDSFVDVAMGHDAVLVHFGASVLCWDYMAREGIQTLDLQFYAAGCWRDPQVAAERGAEHSVKTNAELVTAAIPGKGLRGTLSEDAQLPFTFRHPESFVPADGADCESFSVPFTAWSTSPTAGFDYDDTTRTYAKSQYGGLHIDGTTGEPIRVTNVLVLFTTIYPLDPYGHVAARLTEGGEGYYLSGGKLQEIRWDKGGIYDPLVYTTLDGETLTLNAGKTYVCILTSEMQGNVQYK
ncbi:MAG: DUF3048 domain-containing protein [Clostridiaceae bacterium]|nr:DUF3048 domain-containing protein [Clostridiaceae bacterium]